MRRFLAQLNSQAKFSYGKLSQIPFIFILVAIAVYFWINGAAHFPNWDSSYSQLIMVYIVMMLIFVVWAKRETKKQINLSVQKSAFAFVAFFFVTWILLLIVVELNLLTASEFNINLFWQTIILQICVIATAEELMFRGIILSYIGVFFSAVAFALWHAYAYQILWYQISWSSLNWTALLIAFCMGIILGLVAKDKRFGLPACIAIHAAYNLVLLGVLTIT